MTDTTITAQAARDELYQIARSDGSFQEKARESLELGRRYLGADNGHLTRIDQETGHWEVIASTDAEDGQFPLGLELDLETTYCRRVIESNAQVALHDAPNQGWGDDPAFESHGLHCYHGTPIVLNKKPFGTVCFVREGPRAQFTDGETMFAELIAQFLERELEHAEQEAELTKQTNLALVLNRVLRHNLRNDMTVIRGCVQMMDDKLEDSTHGQIALRNIDGVIELAEKARELDHIIGTDLPREDTDITALLEEIAETVSAEYSHASISVAYEEVVTAAVLPSFERAVRELIENAARHTGDTPTVTISVERVPNAVEIQIVDDGPGLAGHEVDVLQTGSETPLTHGSGLGLWLTHWIVTSHDGSIDASVTDDGTTMAITVPRKSVSAIDQQQTKLQRARDQYKAAFEEADDAMIFINNQAQIIDANPEASSIYGLEHQALLGQPVQRFLRDDFDFEDAWREFTTVSQERDTVTILGADGVQREVEYSATTDVVPGQHLVVSRDVTERVERESELRRKTRAMDEAPVGITLSDPAQEDNPLVYANEQFHELTRYDADETLGRNCRYLQGGETDSVKAARVRQAIDAQEPITETLLNYRKDGTPFWNQLTIAPITDKAGELTNYVGFQEDVTDRIEHERTIKETKQRLQAIVQASPDAIIAVDEDGTIDVWNDAAEAVFGYDADTVIGDSIRSLQLHADNDRPEFERTFERALAGEKLVNHEITRQTKRGEPIHLRLSTAPITDESGSISGVVGVAKHLTENTDSSAPE